MKKIIFKLIQFISLSKIFWGKKKNIYLTFDDGPDLKRTPIILDILKKYQASATFFVIGVHAENNVNLIKRIIKEGHVVANHTYSHSRYIGNFKEYLLDIEKCNEVLSKINVKTNKLFRITYGTVSIKLFIGLLRRGYKIAFWNKDTKDYKLKNADEVESFMEINALKEGDIVLMHDYPDVTPIILERILRTFPDKKFISI